MVSPWFEMQKILRFQELWNVCLSTFSSSICNYWCLRPLLLKTRTKIEKDGFIIIQSRRVAMPSCPLALKALHNIYFSCKLSASSLYIPSFASLLFANILLQMTSLVLICQFSLMFSYFMKLRELNIKNVWYLVYVISWNKVLINSELAETTWVENVSIAK